MSSAAPLQNTAAKSAPPGTSAHRGLLLQRKCTCGSPASSLSGGCAECQGKKLQRSPLAIGASDDRFEQEADRVADAVVAEKPGPPALSPGPMGKVNRDKPTGKCPSWQSPADLSIVAAEHYLLTEFKMALKYTRVLCDGGPMCTVWFTPGPPMDRLNDIEVDVDIGPPFVDVRRVDIRGPSCRYTYDCKDKEPPVFTKVDCIKIPPPSNTPMADKARLVQRSLSDSPQVIARQAPPKEIFGLTASAIPGEQPEYKLPSGEKQEEDESALPRKCNRTIAEATVNDAEPPTVDEVLRSPGRPLDPETRAFMEPRFGYDFSQVRVHSGTAAEQSAREVSAKAYTVGSDIVFAAGQLAPRTHEGRRLLAHELAHAIQQQLGRTPKTSLKLARKAAIPADVSAEQRRDAEDALLESALRRQAEEKKQHPAPVPAQASAIDTLIASDPLSAATVKQLNKLIKSTSEVDRQKAIDLIIADKASLIDKRLLLDGTMKYTKTEGASITREREDEYGEPLPSPVKIPPKAFKDVETLYSEILHEYQHARQNARKSRLSVVPGSTAAPTKNQEEDQQRKITLRNQQEAEAYIVEILKSDVTGISKNPETIRGLWGAVHAQGWNGLEDAEKEPLSDLYERAYVKVKGILDGAGNKKTIWYYPVKKKIKMSPKLLVSQPNDDYEQQADWFAEQVMQGRQAAAQGNQTLHLQPTEFTEIPLNHVILSAGAALGSTIRAFMESRFNHSFANVRVHTDRDAAQSARCINAKAYTAGHHLVFGADQYAPDTVAGKRLLAHELAHVVQQSRASGFLPAPIGETISTPTNCTLTVRRKPVSATPTRKVPGLPAVTEEYLEISIAQLNWQQAIDIIVGALSGKLINPALLKGRTMRFDPTLTWADAQTGRPPFDWATYSKGNPIPVDIGPSTFRVASTAEEYKPGKGIESPSISWLYKTVLHEYRHVEDAQTKSGLPKPGTLRDVIRYVEIYHEEITTQTAKTGLDKQPALIKHLFEVFQGYISALGSNWSSLAKPQKLKMHALHKSAFDAAESYVKGAGISLTFAPLPPI